MANGELELVSRAYDWVPTHTDKGNIVPIKHPLVGTEITVGRDRFLVTAGHTIGYTEEYYPYAASLRRAEGIEVEYLCWHAGGPGPRGTGMLHRGLVRIAEKSDGNRTVRVWESPHGWD